jgi:hypothetical protein
MQHSNANAKVRGSHRIPALDKLSRYHVYASYSQRDFDIVHQIISRLAQLGFKVNDPDRDFIPGVQVTENIITYGIDMCKTTVLFLSKNYLSSGWCQYEANNAVWKYIKTKGKHRVIPVVLHPCPVPRYLRILNCVYACKYQGKQLSDRLVKALTGNT